MLPVLHLLFSQHMGLLLMLVLMNPLWLLVLLSQHMGLLRVLMIPLLLLQLK